MKSLTNINLEGIFLPMFPMKRLTAHLLLFLAKLNVDSTDSNISFGKRNARTICAWTVSLSLATKIYAKYS